MGFKAPEADACTGPVATYHIADDGIPAPLCGLTGDAGRGREIVAGRQGNCLACHAAPIPEQAFHGDIGPPLHGIGGRRSAAALRLQLVNAAHFNEETVMPPFHRIEGLTGVRKDRLGQPLLTAAQVEDVIAYLTILTGPPPQD
ncbi:MAG: sulfur oxidation c-type cytochrome SoxX [Minwuia sp.]|nr:sulfur oxidation c-type cytochrome SoxX [Minwuia sp.]